MRAFMNNPEVKSFMEDPLLTKKMASKVDELSKSTDRKGVSDLIHELKADAKRNEIIAVGVMAVGSAAVVATASSFIGGALGVVAVCAGTSAVSVRVAASNNIKKIDNFLTPAEVIELKAV